MFYVIVNSDTLDYLSFISLQPFPFHFSVEWTISINFCIHFSSQEEAQSTVDFLLNVFDESLDLSIFRMG